MPEPFDKPPTSVKHPRKVFYLLASLLIVIILSVWMIGATRVGVSPTPSQAPLFPSMTQTPAAKLCNKAEYVEDMTIPDGTKITANQTFVKTWKVKNTGVCAWTTRYALVWFLGANRMDANTTPITTVVLPGAETEISIKLKAPAKPGRYQESWRLSDSHQYPFGPGLTVEIVVVP